MTLACGRPTKRIVHTYPCRVVVGIAMVHNRCSKCNERMCVIKIKIVPVRDRVMDAFAMHGPSVVIRVAGPLSLASVYSSHYVDFFLLFPR